MNQVKPLLSIVKEGPVFIPGIYDCLSSRIMEVNNFQAMYLDIESVAASFCGVPDPEMLTSADLLEVVNRITAYAELPMIVDIHNGFGDILNLMRACGQLTSFGTAGICINDQTYGNHFVKTDVVSHGEFAKRIQAVREASGNKECFLLFRTDACALGIDEVIARCRFALENGADAVCAGYPEKAEDIERIAKEVPGIKFHIMKSGANLPDISYDELIKMGYQGVIAPSVSIGGAITCIQELSDALAADKNDFRAEERGYSTISKFELLRVHEWYSLGKQFNENILDTAAINPNDYLKK